MNREEAIMVLKMVEAHGLADEAKRMAIEALKADVVSREEAIQAVDKCRERKNKEIEQLREFYSQKPTIPMFKESEEAYKAWTGEEMGGGRLIDADALHEELMWAWKEATCEEERKTLRWVIDLVDIDSPTVSADRSHGEWTPVCAELPNMGEDVLVSLWGKQLEVGYFAYEDLGVGLTFRTNDFEIRGNKSVFEEVDAWRPLPTPYKGGDTK